MTVTAATGVPLIVSEGHELHNVRTRGYVESPKRIACILDELTPTGWFKPVPARSIGMRRLEEVHNIALIRYLRRTAEAAGEKEEIYPYIFPLRNQERPPADRTMTAGYFCIDTFTPVHRHAFTVAKRAADCAVTAAEMVMRGNRFAYALVRPPGHHAESRHFGGFCYFNNAALAAQRLSSRGRVAILDIDYHHGNGQQDIFYSRPDVLTVSIHGNPKFAYPYYTGFKDEIGLGEGEGANLNLPLPEALDGAGYLTALDKALRTIKAFSPDYLVIALGLDPAKGDPTGTWSLEASDFVRNGQRIAKAGLPTVVVQEGGYRLRTLGKNAKAFFTGLLGA